MGTGGCPTRARGMCRLQVLTYAEPMTFTVMRAVRGTEPTTSGPSEKLRGNLHQAAPMRPAAMDLPYAERIIRLDFASTDFSETIPDDLP